MPGFTEAAVKGVGVTEFQAIFESVKNWGRWGPTPSAER